MIKYTSKYLYRRKIIQEHSRREIIKNQFLLSITGLDFDFKMCSSSVLNNINYYVVC